MNILISGGSGFIGHFLSQQLLTKKHTVKIVTRVAHQHQSSPSLNFVGWDAESLQTAINGSDVVINLAGKGLFEQRWNERVKQELLDSRINSTQALVTAIRKSPSPPKQFISASAVGFYGDTGHQLTDESHPPHASDFSSTLCQRWEEEVSQLPSEMRISIARLGIVLHPLGGALHRLLPAFKWGLGGALGNGNQYFPWIHIKDAINALTFPIENPNISGVYNVCAPQPITNKAFSQQLAKQLGRPCWFNVPKTLLKLSLGESSALLLNSACIDPVVLKKQGFQWQFPSMETALASFF